MRKLLWAMLFGLSLVGAAARAEAPEVDVLNARSGVMEAPTAPLLQRQQVLKALRDNDGGGLISALAGEAALSAFLSDSADETEASVAAKLAEQANSEFDNELIALWTALSAPNGVAKASAQWYPRWQALVPQMLAGAQMGLVGLGTSAAENTAMSPLERAQLNELQWALSGWLSRTDFADRKRFEQALELAREWILSSAKNHPGQLVLSSPVQRLQLLDRAIASGKQLLRNYDLDIDAALASVHFEQVSRDGDHAHIRTSLKLLDVPLVFEQDLHWFEGEWRDSDEVQSILRYRDESDARAADEFVPDAADPLPDSLEEAESKSVGSCPGPTAQ